MFFVRPDKLSDQLHGTALDEQVGKHPAEHLIVCQHVSSAAVQSHCSTPTACICSKSANKHALLPLLINSIFCAAVFIQFIGASLQQRLQATLSSQHCWQRMPHSCRRQNSSSSSSSSKRSGPCQQAQLLSQQKEGSTQQQGRMTWWCTLRLQGLLLQQQHHPR
jgi:hypothetical protein